MLVLYWSNNCNAVLDADVQKFVDDILEQYSHVKDMTVEIGQETVLAGFRVAAAKGKIKNGDLVLRINGKELPVDSKGKLPSYPSELDVLLKYLSVLAV